MRKRPPSQEARDAEPQEVGEPLHTKYRPRHLDDVIGQDAVVKSLKTKIKDPNRSHAYLFTGPAGTGKTTLARILATGFSCEPANIIEVDAASTSGIDDIRALTSTLRYNGFGDTPNKAIIIDECHALSKAAWQALLKSLEEPPPHVFFFLCTTETGKVPETIVTRCNAYGLKPVKFDDIMDVLELVADKERMDTSDGILKLVARACDGSVRKALTMLSVVKDCEDEDEASRLLETAVDNKEVIDLCRALVSGKLKRWTDVTDVLKAMGEMSPESIRIVVVNYLNSCLMGAKTDDQALRLLDILAQFSKPMNPSDKMGPVLLAFGNVMFP